MVRGTIDLFLGLTDMLSSTPRHLARFVHHRTSQRVTERTTAAMSGVVLITGATGKRGGSVIDTLYEAHADMEILAVT
jgi:hypothetical protein